MQPLEMGGKILDDIYKVKNYDSSRIESDIKIGQVTEKEKFKAAKQILLGLAILYVLTLAAFIVKPNEGRQLLDITNVTFPPLATLILAAYFRNQGH